MSGSSLSKLVNSICKKKSAGWAECVGALKQCDEACRQASLDTKNARLLMGKLIIHWAALNNLTWTEAIAELTGEEGSYLSVKSMMKYPRIVEWGFGSDILRSKWIPISLLEEASSCAMPEKPDKRKKFKDAVEGRMRGCILNNETPSKKDFRHWLRQLQDEHGAPSPRRGVSQEMLLDYIQLTRIALLPPVSRDAYLGPLGHKFRDVIEKMKSIEASLINMEMIPANPEDRDLPSLKGE